MCKSAANGGQRCISHATTRMLKALTRYENAQQAVDDAESPAEAARAQQRALTAFEKFDAARIDYASTPQGEEDLLNRLAAAQSGAEETSGWTPAGQRIDNPVDLETAIIAGRMTRKRNEVRARRARQARAMATLGRVNDRDVLVVSHGTSDLNGMAYLPKGAHVRVRTEHSGAPEGMFMVQRVTGPGEQDAAGAEGNHARPGAFYLIPMTTLARPDENDATASFLQAHPDHTGQGPDADDGFFTGTDDSLTAASGF